MLTAPARRRRVLLRKRQFRPEEASGEHLNSAGRSNPLSPPRVHSASAPALQNMARPSSYSDEIAEEICARLADGEPLVRMCRDEHLPHVVTVYRWLNSNELFRNMYARAREDQADTLADEIIDIADSAKDANLGRLQVDSRKWVAAKLKPKKYSERMELEHSGRVTSVHEVNDDELAAIATGGRARVALKATSAEEPAGVHAVHEPTIRVG